MAVTFQFSVVAGIGLRNNAVGSLAWKVSTTALVSLVVSLGSLVTFYVCWMNFVGPGHMQLHSACCNIASGSSLQIALSRFHNAIQ